MGAAKLLTALALLPEKLIKDGFHVIWDIIFNNSKYLESFFKYYTDTWLNGFKPNSFCVYKELDRTNNIPERHNRELKESLEKHSTIVAFLGKLSIAFNSIIFLQFNCSYTSILFTANLTEHQKSIHSMLRHPIFWTRTRSSLKVKELEIQKMWQLIEDNSDDLDLLDILYKLSKLVGK